jgi:hypothetical protein
LLPLVAQREFRDIGALCNCITYVLTRYRDIVCKLNGNACYEFARMTKVAATSVKEEAGS